MKHTLNTKTIKILFYLNNVRQYPRINLIKKLNISNAFCWAKLKLLESQGLVSFNSSNKDKRLRTPRITEKGVEVVRLLNKIKELVE